MSEVPATGHTCPPEHSHGENLTCYTHGCRCDDCKAANRDRAFWYRHMIATGRAARIDSLVDSTPARRRIEALMTLGWSQTALAARLPFNQAQVSRVLLWPRIRRSTASAIAGLYEQLADQTPATDTVAQRMSVHRTRALAARRGYARPIDWDDIDLDEKPHRPPRDPDLVDVVAIDIALTSGRVHRVRLTTAERHIAVQRLVELEYTDGAIAELLSVSIRTIQRDREHLALASPYAPTRAAA